MPIDTRLIPALEQELIFARQTSPGGQPPNPERIAAIEEELAKYRAEAAARGEYVEPAPENLSEQSENYETSDDAASRREEDVAKKKASKVKQEAAAAVPEVDELELADASEPVETA